MAPRPRSAPMGEDPGCPWGQPHRSFPGPVTVKKRVAVHQSLLAGCEDSCAQTVLPTAFREKALREDSKKDPREPPEFGAAALLPGLRRTSCSHAQKKEPEAESKHGHLKNLLLGPLLHGTWMKRREYSTGCLTAPAQTLDNLDETVGRLAAKVSKGLPPVADWMRGGQAPQLSCRVLLLGNRFAASSNAGPVTPVKRRLHQLTAALRFHLSRRLRARHELSQAMLSNPALENPVNLEAAQRLIKDESLYKQVVLGLFNEPSQIQNFADSQTEMTIVVKTDRTKERRRSITLPDDDKMAPVRCCFLCSSEGALTRPRSQAPSYYAFKGLHGT
ncbi:hypothetical protein PANDA_006101 [Ailuropoda melanoleuca]|uniref:Uncharacterized protein n=1 Tax=Ailuropoda melanoleuca TaxID=9646 RepID=D2H7H9_AILME|nr:hypothetical protein PANDA_006101 [Ailuropoda melanoleuca]